MATFYARITPTNGVNGDVYAVTVTGVAATVEGQKTWTNGTLSFAITPSGTGTMVITYKNLTLNQIIGTKSIVIHNNDAVPMGELNMGSFTITCGRSNRAGDANIYYYGFSSISTGGQFGSLDVNTAKYYDVNLTPEVCWVLDAGNLSTITFRFKEITRISSTIKYDIKFTNLTTGENTLISPSDPEVWFGGVVLGKSISDPTLRAKWLRIFTVGQKVRVDLLPLSVDLQV